MANTLSEFFEREWSAIGAAKTKSIPVEKVRRNCTQDSNRFARKQLETFSRMNVLLRNPTCDALSPNEFINQHIHTCQMKRSHEQQKMEQMERTLCGALVKVAC